MLHFHWPVGLRGGSVNETVRAMNAHIQNRRSERANADSKDGQPSSGYGSREYEITLTINVF